MPACRSMIVAVSAALLTAAATAFVPSMQPAFHTAPLKMAAEKVEVCSFKDCKRAGGGPRLEKHINQILEEKGLTGKMSVALCDCQGECGYGPNLVVDGKIVNDVKGREAIESALGIQEVAAVAAVPDQE